MNSGLRVLAGLTAPRRLDPRDEVQSRSGYQETMVRILRALYPCVGGVSWFDTMVVWVGVGVRRLVIREEDCCWIKLGRAAFLCVMCGSCKVLVECIDASVFVFVRAMEVDDEAAAFMAA